MPKASRASALRVSSTQTRAAATNKQPKSVTSSRYETEYQEPAFVTLKNALTITPKTTLLLFQLGYTTHTSLAAVSPNKLLAQFRAQPVFKSNPKVVEGYRRAIRRLVWLGALPEPEKIVKECGKWTNRTLKERGIWPDEETEGRSYDDLTGAEVEERFGEKLRELVGA